MVSDIHIEDWGPGWTALAFTVALGVSVIFRSWTLRRATRALTLRILVAGSRGKSGTVRVLHGLLRNAGLRVIGKVTGTIAIELSPDGSQQSTMRFGAAGIPEMRSALLRGHRYGAFAAVMECMAVQPKMISLVARIIQPHILVIPAIRLDHLEDEGLSEYEIGVSTIEALGKAEHLVTAVDQPDLQRYYREYCERVGMRLHLVTARSGQPVVAGQHPTNVALGLRIAEILKMETDGFESSVSIEPEAAIRREVQLPDRKLSFCDIGGANDPQSAADALHRLQLPADEQVVPIIINRWDRPLRAVSFLAAVDGNFPAVLISGTLPDYGQALIHRYSPNAVVVPLKKSVARNLHHLVDLLEMANPELAGKDLCLVAMQNTHDPAAEAIRSEFIARGTAHPIGEWGVLP